MDQDKAHLGQSAPPRTQLPVIHPRVFPFLPPAPPTPTLPLGWSLLLSSPLVPRLSALSPSLFPGAGNSWF